MEKKECIYLLAIIKELFPNERASSDPKIKVNAWFNVLRDFSFLATQQAIYDFARKDIKGFPPAPGQIINAIIERQLGENLTEMQAWSLVSKAVANSAYNYQKEFEKLPEAVQRGIGAPEQLKLWSALDGKSLNTVVMSNFMRSYSSNLKRDISVLSCGTSSIPVLSNILAIAE